VRGPEIAAWLGEVVGAEPPGWSRHDRWLCLMFPRLQLLRRLLAEDGVIFISIDDEELGSLLAICDEIFGRTQRLAIFTWVRKRKGSNLSRELRKVTEYVVAYKGSPGRVDLYGVPAYAEKQVPLINRANAVGQLVFPPGSVKVGRGVPEGAIAAGSFGKGELAVTLDAPILVAERTIATGLLLSGRFRWSQATVDHELAQGSVFTASRDFRVNVARHDQAAKVKAPSSLLTPDDGIGTNEDATLELRALFPERDKLPFDFPKPVSLLKFLVRSVCRNDRRAIVLDAFAGSGTTGVAVMALNAVEGADRRFILVEIDGALCREVTAERLRRAAAAIADRHPDRPSPGFAGFVLGEPAAGVAAAPEAAAQPISVVSQ